MSFFAVADYYGDFGSAVEGSAVHGECASYFNISNQSVKLKRVSTSYGLRLEMGRPLTALHQFHSS